MKTAISIPDNIFEAAESMAHHLKISRSELFATAISEYMKSNKSKNITASLNEVYSSDNSNVDEQLASMQRSSIDDQENW